MDIALLRPFAAAPIVLEAWELPVEKRDRAEPCSGSPAGAFKHCAVLTAVSLQPFGSFEPCKIGKACKFHEVSKVMGMASLASHMRSWGEHTPGGSCGWGLGYIVNRHVLLQFHAADIAMASLFSRHLCPQRCSPHPGWNAFLWRVRQLCILKGVNF